VNFLYKCEPNRIATCTNPHPIGAILFPPLQLAFTAPLIAALLALPMSAQVKSESDAPTTSASMSVPDGTPVEMRFAQAVVGSGSNARRDAEDQETPQAEPGDKVRLVAAGDVRSGGVLIVAKGALGQATVTQVKSTLRTFSSGIRLQLDWIEDTNGKRLPLRATATGTPQGMMMFVRKTSAGVVAGPERKGKVQSLTGEFRNAGKESIPAGTRIVGYVQGSVPFEIRKAGGTSLDQALATLTVYRLTGGSGEATAITCDANQIGIVGAQRYLVSNLPAGKHSCHAGAGKTLDLVLDADGEYFARIDAKEMSLTVVSVGEGEDAIAGLEQVK